MTDNDRYTDPKDNARHAVESLTIIFLLSPLVILAIVLGAMS